MNREVCEHFKLTDKPCPECQSIPQVKIDFKELPIIYKQKVKEWHEEYGDKIFPVKFIEYFRDGSKKEIVVESL